MLIKRNNALGLLNLETLNVSFNHSVYPIGVMYLIANATSA